MAGPVKGGAGVVEVYPFERGGEAIRVAFAPDLAVGDDVDPGALQVADREDRGVVLGLLEVLGCDSPDLQRAGSWRQATAEHRAVDEPIGLGIAADDGRQQDILHRANLRGADRKSTRLNPVTVKS